MVCSNRHFIFLYIYFYLSLFYFFMFFLCYIFFFFFFFFSSRRRHTRFDCDWSSDVCSSDLVCWRSSAKKALTCWPVMSRRFASLLPPASRPKRSPFNGRFSTSGSSKIGRASCRERV